MRFPFSQKNKAEKRTLKYQDMQTPDLLPSDESSNGGGSFSDSYFREEPPRMSFRKTPLRAQPDYSFDYDSADEMRQVLRDVGAIDGGTTNKKRQPYQGWSARRSSISTKEATFKEPVWKRRLRTLKSALVPPEQMGSERAMFTTREHDKAQYHPRNGMVKTVSFDEVSLDHPSAADSPTAVKKKRGQTSEETLRNKEGGDFKRSGSSFSDFFRRVTEDDLFSVDTPSFWSEQTSISSEDDTTITSYQYKMPKIPSCKRSTSSSSSTSGCGRHSCGTGEQHPEQVNSLGCGRSDSLLEDLRIVAELLIRDATCHTFMTGEGIPPQRDDAESNSSS